MFRAISNLIFNYLLFVSLLPLATMAQNEQPPSLNIGNPAPALQVKEWLKGSPILGFEKGNVYVLEFWATWCAPCKAAMPHLSALARQYEDKITFIGIDVMEKKTVPIEKIRHFVDSVGTQMDYRVAAQDSNFMEIGWMQSSGESGIPKTFIVDAEGRLAWIGHPKDLAEVLPKILSNKWDVKKEEAERNFKRRLAKLDQESTYDLLNYLGDPRTGDPGRPDSALLVIKELVRKEPALKYAPGVASCTFSSLLKTDLQKAYEYGEAAIVVSTYMEPAYAAIIGVIENYSNKSKLNANIYRLGAKARQAQIDNIPYPEIVNLSKPYNKMADWYWRAGDKEKSIAAQQKAIEALKSKNDFTAAELATLKSRLQQYKK